MISSSRIVLGLGVALTLPLLADRLVINEKRAPSGRADLEQIQKHLTAVLPAAREATVAIDLEEGSGSGVIVSEDGLILTAAHVTMGIGRPLDVIFEDGKRVKAESLGLHSDYDCAMARIVEEGSYPHVELEGADRAKLGDWVFALGHSNGFDKARGSVVRLGRLVRTTDTTFQSDCNLIGGDSGGPLFDLEGRLVGIHSRVGVRLPENMHAPIRIFEKYWDEMRAGEFLGDGPFAKRPEKGKAFLGIAVEAAETGLRVKRVGRESPAERAGIRKDDVILSMDGQSLATEEQFSELMKEKAPDDPVAFEMLRDGKVETLTLRLGDREA